MFDREINLSVRVNDNDDRIYRCSSKTKSTFNVEQVKKYPQTKKSSDKRWKGNEVTNKLPSFILSSAQSQ